MNLKRRAVLDRIESIEQSIVRAREYLESGKHAHWIGFKPVFTHKLKDGKELPPHKDWIKNVFLPATEKALSRAEKTLERLESHSVLMKLEHRTQNAVAGLIEGGICKRK